MTVKITNDRAAAVDQTYFWQPLAATRRAIVRAAAEIGRSMA